MDEQKFKLDVVQRLTKLEGLVKSIDDRLADSPCSTHRKDIDELKKKMYFFTGIGTGIGSTIGWIASKFF